VYRTGEDGTAPGVPRRNLNLRHRCHGVLLYLFYGRVLTWAAVYSLATMIESSPLTVNFARTELGDNTFEDLVDGIGGLEYSRNRSYGFVIESLDPERVSAHLVITTPVKIQDYDEERQEIVDKQVDKTELIPFRIDVEHNFLEVFSNQSDTGEVKTRLGEAIGWDISITEAPINLAKLYDALSVSDYETEITSIQISNFSVDNNTTGSYRMKVFEESEGIKYVSEYQNDVSYLAVKFKNEVETATVGFYRSGSIRIYSNIENDSHLLDNIKMALNSSDEVMQDA